MINRNKHIPTTYNKDRLSDEDRQSLMLLIDVISMEFLPKKIVLVSRKNNKLFGRKERITEIRFTSKQVCTNVDYNSDFVWSTLKSMGFNYNLLDVKYYCNVYNRRKEVKSRLKVRLNNYLKTV